jgi:hypothetical protein
MHEQQYDPYGNASHSQMGMDMNGGAAGGYDAYGNPVGGYDPNQQAYYQQQGYAQYPNNGYGYDAAGGDAAGAAALAAGAGAGAAAAGSQEQHQAQGNGTGSAIAAQMGLRDGMMVNVKVGFVRTLEDELGMCTTT